MFGGVITLIFGMVISFVMYKVKVKEKWILARKLLVFTTIPLMIIIAVYEKSIGHFSSWFWAFFINIWELSCFDVGLFCSDLFIKLKIIKIRENLNR